MQKRSTSISLFGTILFFATLVPEDFFYSLLANFATRTASFVIIIFLLARSTEQSALHVANFQIKKIISKESLSDQDNFFAGSS